jgi:hypothetical protein
MEGLDNQVMGEPALRAGQWRAKGEFVTRSIAGETIIVPVRGQVGDLEAIYTVNEVGAFIWELIGHGVSIHQIVEAVSNEFEVMPEDAEKDVRQFIGLLEAAGIVEPSDPRS